MTPPSVDPALLADLAAAALAQGAREAVAVVRSTTGTVPESGPAPAPATEPAPPAPARDRPSSLVDGGPPHLPDGAPTTLQQALRQAADLAPDKGTTFLRGGVEASRQTYPELLAEAQRVLAGLRAAGLRPGDAALFQFEDNRDYLTAFWGCVLGGFVPTPVAVAASYAEHSATTRRLRNAWLLLERPVVLTGRGTARALEGVRELWGEPDVRVLVVQDLLEHEPDAHWHPTGPDSPVVHLLTSGSTGVPKCVQHTNSTVAARTWAAARACGYGPDEVTVNWMPLDHVAIVMHNVRDVFLRCDHVNARVEDFLADPLAWLDWLDRYRATDTWAPNFAFAMVNDALAEERAAGRGWDLSRLRSITNAAEPVVAATSHRFLELLAPHGLPADAVRPGWGMSETCSVVTYATQSRDDRAAGVVVVSQATLGADTRTTDPGAPDALVFSEAGPPVPGVAVRVVDPGGAVLPEDALGELQVRGTALMTGYRANPEANRDSHDADGWFRTGDLAFVHGGSVVIAGRAKDQIVIRGVNHVAHEIESVVERVDGVRLTFAAAAGVREPGEGSDRLVVFFVPERWEEEALARTAGAVREALVREVGPAPDLVVPVTAAEFPKTGSGKIQRGALVEALRAGRFADRTAGPERDERPEDWLFGRRWRPVADDATAPRGVDGPVVVLAGERAWRDLAPAFRDVTTVVVPRPASGEAADHVRRAVAEATRRHGAPAALVLAWSLHDDLPASPVRAAVELSAALTAATPLLVLTSGAVRARAGDRVDLGVCGLPGLVRTAVSEGHRVRQVDLPADPARWAVAARRELAGGAGADVLAVRGGERLRAVLRPVRRADLHERPPVAPGGRYLVTGGLGGIAHHLGTYLVAAYGVRLLLIGRSAPTGERADRLAELSALGDVVYREADVADRAALAGAVAEAERRWGAPLDGVLHLAGADPSDQWEHLERHTAAEETEAGFARLHRAKVDGTLALAEVLEDRPDAALVLFGSVNGEFGGHSFGAYAAANTFLVGFADHWRHERGRDARCLAWSMWTDAGLNRGRPTAPVRRSGFRPVRGEEGLASFLAAMALDEPYVLIGLDRASQRVLAELEPRSLRPQEVLLAYAADADLEPGGGLDALITASPVPVRLHRVPALPTDARGGPDREQLLQDTAPRPRRAPTEPPRTPLEERMALVWAEVLNRPTPGRDDTFFDLGGNSLRAARLLSRLSADLPVPLTLDQLYRNPTIAALAAVIEPVG